MAVFTDNFKKDSFILRMLVSRDFKLKYRRSVLGILWSILNPLFMMIIISAVFYYIFRFDIDYYSIYLILGLILFNFMSASTSAGTISILSAAPLIKKIRVNKLIFPLQTVLFELVGFALSLIAVVIVVIFYPMIFNQPPVPIGFDLLLLPVLLVYMVMFCVGLSLMLSALAVFFRDVIHLWNVIIVAWTYATPIFYPLKALEDAPEFLQSAMVFNPMYQFITYFRNIVISEAIPSLMDNLVCFSIGAVVLLIGLLVFRKTERKFILHV